jgi:hypothetical protein
MLLEDLKPGTILNGICPMAGGLEYRFLRYVSTPAASQPGYCGLIVGHNGDDASVIIIDMTRNKKGSGINAVLEGLIESVALYLYRYASSERLPVEQIRWFQAFEWDFDDDAPDVRKRNPDIFRLIPEWCVRKDGTAWVFDIRFEQPTARETRNVASLIESELWKVQETEYEA